MVPPSMRKSNPPANRLKHVLLLACFLCTLSWMALCGLNGGIQLRPFLPPSPKSVIQMNYSSFGISTLEMGISDEEWERLQKALDWPGPDQQITQLNLSTSPVHSTFSIVELKKSYKVGDNISVIITARDHNKNLKRYGGDFFKVKLFNSKLKASVYGEVVDHRNGTYSVVLLLPWEGQAQVFVRLEHSSEVVQILKKYRESSFPRSHYNGHFEGPGAKNTKISEVVECNLKWGAKGSLRTSKCCCEYKDIKTGNEWQCERPKKLPCDKMVGHSMGRFESPLNHFENQLFSKKLTNVAIIGDKTIINVLPNTEVIGTTERCRSDLTTPVPAGFYFKDVWKSFVHGQSESEEGGSLGRMVEAAPDTPQRPALKQKRMQKYRRKWEESNTWLESVSGNEYQAQFVGECSLLRTVACQICDSMPRVNNIHTLYNKVHLLSISVLTNMN